MFTTAALRRIRVRIIDVFIEVKDVVGVHAETYFLLKQITKASIFFFFSFAKLFPYSEAQWVTNDSGLWVEIPCGVFY